MPAPWQALEEITGLIALPAVWNKHTGSNFAAFKILCLETSSKHAKSYPCPLATSCSYRIVPQIGEPNTAPQLFHGYCQRNPPRCEHITLGPEEITALQLNWSRLARALCRALNLDTKITSLNLPNTLQIGSWSADAVPVILSIQTERRHFRHIICELIARIRLKFILLAPTTKHMDAAAQELLQNANAAIFTLDNIVTISESGNLQPTKIPGELFAKFAPEEKLPEDAALRAFAVLKSMDTDRRLRKASVFTVFRLYCMENLSAETIAKRLGCGKTTVIERLQVIRQKTGTEPAKLRAYSAQFTRIEQSLSDPRARRIGRQSAGSTPESEREE